MLLILKKTQIIQKGNIIGTKYETVHKTLNIRINNQDKPLNQNEIKQLQEEPHFKLLLDIS